MTAERKPPPRPGDDQRGAHLSFSPPEGYVESGEDDFTVAGTVIRLMWDHGVGVPLWDAEGLLPEEPEWLGRALGLSDELVRDLAEWGSAMDHLVGGLPAAEQGGRRDPRRTTGGLAELDIRARALVERLRVELSPRFEVTYIPW